MEVHGKYMRVAGQLDQLTWPTYLQLGCLTFPQSPLWHRCHPFTRNNHMIWHRFVMVCPETTDLHPTYVYVCWKMMVNHWVQQDSFIFPFCWIHVLRSGYGVSLRYLFLEPQSFWFWRCVPQNWRPLVFSDVFHCQVKCLTEETLSRWPGMCRFKDLGSCCLRRILNI